MENKRCACSQSLCKKSNCGKKLVFKTKTKGVSSCPKLKPIEIIKFPVRHMNYKVLT